MPNRPERVPGWCRSLGCLGVTKQEPPRPGGGNQAVSDQPLSHLASWRLSATPPLFRGQGCCLPCLGCAEDQGKGLPPGSRALGLSGGGGGRAHSSRQRRSSERAPRRLVASAHWRNATGNAQSPAPLPRSERAPGRPKVQGSLSALPVQPNRKEHWEGKSWGVCACQL